jgi:hypothetical protein
MERSHPARNHPATITASATMIATMAIPAADSSFSKTAKWDFPGSDDAGGGNFAVNFGRGTGFVI